MLYATLYDLIITTRSEQQIQTLYSGAGGSLSSPTLCGYGGSCTHRAGIVQIEPKEHDRGLAKMPKDDMYSPHMRDVCPPC